MIEIRKWREVTEIILRILGISGSRRRRNHWMRKDTQSPKPTSNNNKINQNASICRTTSKNPKYCHKQQ